MSTYGYVAHGARGAGSPYSSSIINQYPRSLSSHFEYIDADHDILQDRDTHRPSLSRLHHNPEPPEEPDRVLVRYMASIYPIHFAPYSISEEGAYVGELREQTAAFLQTDPQRIRLVYKSRDLKHDSWPLKRYHIKQNSEVAAIKTEGPLDYSDRESASSSGSDTEATQNQNPRRRPRALSSVRHRSDDSIPRTQQPPRTSATHLHPNGHISAGTPFERQSRGTLHPDADPRQYQRREPSRSSQRRDHTINVPSATTFTPISISDPTTPLGKLQTLSNTLRGTWLPLCEQYIANPPSDPQSRAKEHRKLTESIMQHITLKADAIDVDSPDARSFRKSLINEINDLNKTMDAVARA
ncbi:hypothetical protein B0A52_05232 [Exophiala mesophila]|uniref:BAG domain-containing protein n=1 Tax=Exophiala mesophila TaxID=212818 RepID=A0A438N4H1_EXOME|nr:hypothetical protein B0A52_05232 [Exophiala mesophila]